SDRNRKACDHECINLVRLHFVQELRYAVHISFRSAGIQSQILPERITTLRQHTNKDRAEWALVVERIPRAYRAEPIDVGCCLCGSTRRAGHTSDRGAADKSDEIAAPHV